MDITEYTDFVKELPATCSKNMVRVCRRCHTKVTPSEVDGYSWYCPEHDEDLYDFETEMIDAWEEGKERIQKFMDGCRYYQNVYEDR